MLAMQNIVVGHDPLKFTKVTLTVEVMRYGVACHHAGNAECCTVGYDP